MSEFLNTENKTAQYNGPVNSSDYNLKIEQNYQDLVHLYNRSGILDQKLHQAFERVLKDQLFLGHAVKDLEDRLKAIENTSGSNKVVSFYSYSQFDNASFIATDYAVPASEALSFDYIHNVVTLPKVDGASSSKLKFFNAFTGQVVPDFFEAKIENNFTSVDSPGAVIDTSPIYHAVLDSSDKFWKRNVIADSASAAPAQAYVYFKIPTSYSGSDKSNYMCLTPYPMFGVDIMSIEYTTLANPSMSESDGWTPLNFNKLYDGEAEAVGKVPPGGWTVSGQDVILNSGPVAFYFPPVTITAVRVNIRQRNYIEENGKCIYTYGLSDIDIRSNKFMPTGKSIVRFDAPSDTVIFDVIKVTPKIYNVPEQLIPSVFDYRIIYKDSGVYTLENPGSSSSIWVEVSLTQLGDGTNPVLSDLVIEYE
jgi:hypothetical protein